MLVPELLGLLNPIPRAVNHTDPILFGTFQIVRTDKFLAESGQDDALELLLAVTDAAEQFEPLHLLARALLAVALLEVHHEKRDLLLRLLDLLPTLVLLGGTGGLRLIQGQVLQLLLQLLLSFVHRYYIETAWYAPKKEELSDGREGWGGEDRGGQCLYNSVRMDKKIEEFDTPPPNYLLTEHATHGFSTRPSPAQLASYLVIALSIAVYFSSTVSLLHSPALLSLYCLFGLTMSLSSLAATLCDPTDRVVYFYKWSRHDRQISFIPDYSKVLFCEFCDSYCSADSKHCRSCNRCVNHFDHHCMWFNNCVGRRNYWLFMLSILATFAYAAVVIVHVVIGSVAVDLNDGSQLAKAVMGWVVGVVLAVFAFLLGNLIALHLYLLATGQTTYQFLQRKKKEEAEEKAEKEKLNSSKVALDRPEPGSHQGNSQVSIAPTKKIVVGAAHNVELPPASNDTRPTSSKRAKRKQRQISNDMEGDLKQEEGEEGKSQDQSIQEENDATFVHEEGEERGRSDSSMERLPPFLRQNRSLKLLLAQQTAESPSRKRLQAS